MKIRALLLLLAFTLVGLGVWLKILERREILKLVEEQRRFLPEFDSNVVAEVLVKSNAETATLRKTSSGWVVAELAGQPANLAAIGEVVQRLHDFKSRENVAVDPSQFASFELLEPDGKSAGAGTLVSLKDPNGKTLAAVVIGKTSFSPPDPGSQFPPQPNGRFILVAGSSGPVRVASEGLDKLSAKPEDWLDRP
jgi:hypothetical protein